MSFRRTALAVAGIMVLLLSIVVVTRPGDEVALTSPDGSNPPSLAVGETFGPSGTAVGEPGSEGIDSDSNGVSTGNYSDGSDADPRDGSSDRDAASSNDSSNGTTSSNGVPATLPSGNGTNGNGTNGNSSGSTDGTTYQRPGSTVKTPVTAAPGTGSNSPTSDRPASTQPVVTQPGVTQPSQTQPPTTKSPAKSPTTKAPTTRPPATQTSTTQTPTTQAPVTQAPVSSGTAFAGVNLADWTNSDAIVSSNGQPGSFRTACTTSHFNFDDAIVFPGQRNATHLHMYFGNTEANYASTGDSLAASGDGTCQGGQLNRSAYWVPAVMDRNGQARPAQYMLAYYKRAGDEEVVPFPNGLKIVVGNAMSHNVQPGREQPIDAGIDYRWYCGSPITTGAYSSGRLIPNCAQGDFLTLSLIFPRCGDGRLDSADHKSHMAYPAYYGGPCPSSHPIRHPQLTYNIHWNNNDTNTAGWYLSSDDHRAHGDGLLPGGTTTHADWIGAWHPDVLTTMTTGCLNAPHDCKGGTISPSLRLNGPNVQGYSPSNIYNRGATLPPLDPSQFR